MSDNAYYTILVSLMLLFVVGATYFAALEKRGDQQHDLELKRIELQQQTTGTVAR